MKKVLCLITNKEIDINLAIKCDSIRDPLVNYIQKDFPSFDHESYISIDSLNIYRKKYIESIIATENKEIDILDKAVLKAVIDDELLTDKQKPGIEDELTLGQRMADKIAEFGGSWTFIIFFFSFILVWICMNIFLLQSKVFDPYPFILLNLILSCLASIQAPIIMMSQNRKEQKDRYRGEQDYKVNLKAELEIKLLHEKMDHLILHQNKKLLEIQEIQSDYLEDILRQIKTDK